MSISFPPLGISLHTSHSQKPGWSHAGTGARSVWLHWFCQVLEAENAGFFFFFFLEDGHHAARWGMRLCLPLTISWADCYRLLKSPALSVAGSAPCSLCRPISGSVAREHPPPVQTSRYLPTCVPPAVLLALPRRSLQSKQIKDNL